MTAHIDLQNIKKQDVSVFLLEKVGFLKQQHS